jgi:NADH-quinone oxidoreductase subunit J
LATDLLLFYLFGAIAAGASLLVVLGRNPMHSVLLLIVSFAALAGLYIGLEAPFAAVVQIIIYAGAIMVLFLFVVMLLNAPREDAAAWDRSHPLRHPNIGRFGMLLAALLVAQLGWALASVNELDTPIGARADAASVSSVVEMGRVLFSRHTFAFDATSVLILVAMVGAVVLARREGSNQ